MKKILVASLMMLVLATSISLTSVIAEEHHGATENFCHNPSRTISIATKGSEVAFNNTEINVDKGECVTIMFINMQDAEHDLALNFANGTEYFGLHIVGNGTAQMRMVNALMPNEDTEMPFWCTIEDHKDQGMEGKIIVGNGFSAGETGAERAPGFGFLSSTLAVMTAFVLVYKKKSKK